MASAFEFPPDSPPLLASPHPSYNDVAQFSDTAEGGSSGLELTWSSTGLDQAHSSSPSIRNISLWDAVYDDVERDLLSGAGPSRGYHGNNNGRVLPQVNEDDLYTTWDRPELTLSSNTHASKPPRSSSQVAARSTPAASDGYFVKNTVNGLATPDYFDNHTLSTFANF